MKSVAMTPPKVQFKLLFCLFFNLFVAVFLYIFQFNLFLFSFFRFGGVYITAYVSFTLRCINNTNTLIFYASIACTNGSSSSKIWYNAMHTTCYAPQNHFTNSFDVWIFVVAVVVVLSSALLNSIKSTPVTFKLSKKWNKNET